MAAEQDIPVLVDDSEIIVRVIYEPTHLKNKNLALRNQAFRSPAEKDEVSVTRLDYSNATFCKSYGKKHEAPANKRTYYGLAVLRVSYVRSLEANVLGTALEDNPAHADITIGYVAQKGVQLPAEYSYMVEEMASAANIFPDPDIPNPEWTGNDLIPKNNI